MTSVAASHQASRAQASVGKSAIKTHWTNAAFGVVDYLASPVGMLVVAPIALRHLGAQQFGIWMVVNAVITIGSIIASGFGDANIRAVATARSSSDRAALICAVRATLGIHLALGTLAAGIAWILAPFIAAHLAPGAAPVQSASLACLHISAALILVRAVETVCVSTQRAFERYGAAIAASVTGRIFALAAAVFAPIAARGVVAVVIAMAALVTAALAVQLFQLTSLLGVSTLRPSFDQAATRSLLGYGVFTWLQAVSSVAFAQADRLMTGLYLGAAAVTAYALCAQLAQPIYGIVASGLHFLFPYVASRTTAGSLTGVRRFILLTLAANVLAVATGACTLLLWGNDFLKHWVTPSVAQAGASVLPLLVAGTSAQGLGITGTYTLLAVGRVRWVTLVNLAGGVAMVVAAPFLIPRFGLHGVALARLLYGPCTLLVYLPFVQLLGREAPSESQEFACISICSEVAP